MVLIFCQTGFFNPFPTENINIDEISKNFNFWTRPRFRLIVLPSKIVREKGSPKDFLITFKLYRKMKTKKR